MLIKFNPVTVEQVMDPMIASSGVKVFMLRLDKNHEHISGNKWYKLKYNLIEAEREGKNKILTFGGAYSNHIAATAAAGKELGFKTVGIIRGEASEKPNQTMDFAKECGMEIHYISREEYRKKNEPELIENLKEKFGNFYLIPEGGHNVLGLKGCMEILKNININFDHVCCSCGTGTTLAGIVMSLQPGQQAIGFSSLKGAEFLAKDIQELINSSAHAHYTNWNLNHDYHFGRYAKVTNELKFFIERFKDINHIPLDHVYTGKMMYGIFDMIKKGMFTEGEVVLAIHTGGLQGNKSFDKELLSSLRA